MTRTVIGRNAAGLVVDIALEGDEGPVGGGGGAHPDLAAHQTLGLAASHAHDYSASGHNHDAAYSATGHGHTHDHDGTYAPTHSHPYAATSHSHLDADIPEGIARDSEVTSEIATHAATPHGGSLPSGLIVMWGGLVANIPAGWVLCDGNNGTPNLTDRFIKGTSGNPGATGGAATHTHAGHSDHAALSHSAHTGATVANHTDVLNHTHPENRNSATTGGLDGWAAGDTSTNTPIQTGYVTGNPTANGVAAQVHTVGQASAHTDHAAQSHSAHDSPNSEPAYYALCFIQKV